ncbi:MAG: hypothetical protein ACKVOR_12845 [Flavobacteriales bacterium]
MKIFKTLLLAVCLASTTGIVAQNTITATEAHVTINSTTTREQLAQLRTDLLAQGIDFRYNPQFDGQRNIVSITFTITANEGAVTGTGEHKMLKNTNASITFHVNKTDGTFNVETVANPGQN